MQEDTTMMFETCSVAKAAILNLGQEMLLLAAQRGDVVEFSRNMGLYLPKVLRCKEEFGVVTCRATPNGWQKMPTHAESVKVW